MTLNWTATDDEDAPIWKAETEAGTYEAGYDCGAWAAFEPKNDTPPCAWSWSGSSGHTAADAKAIAEAIHAITHG